jgi:hypothetical protein
VRPGLAEVAGGLLMLRVIVETVSMAFAGMNLRPRLGAPQAHWQAGKVTLQP